MFNTNVLRRIQISLTVHIHIHLSSNDNCNPDNNPLVVNKQEEKKQPTLNRRRCRISLKGAYCLSVRTLLRRTIRTGILALMPLQALLFERGANGNLIATGKLSKSGRSLEKNINGFWWVGDLERFDNLFHFHYVLLYWFLSSYFYKQLFLLIFLEKPAHLTSK